MRERFDNDVDCISKARQLPKKLHSCTTCYLSLVPRSCMHFTLYQCTGHTLPLKVIGFGTPLAIGELKVKLSSPISPVLYLPSGQLLGFLSFDVDDPRRQKTN